MKFSVISAVFNHKKYLPKLQEALENQTFKDFEWIIGDDGSTDGTEAPETTIKAVYLKHRNKGLTKTLNRCLKKAQGEYVVLIMGDSFPELDYLEQLNDWLTENEGIVCGSRVHINNNSIIDIDYRLKNGLIPQDPVLLIDAPYNSITGNGLAIPRRALVEAGGWDEKIKKYGGDDNLIVAKLFHRGLMVWSVPQLILYHHYHHSNDRKDNLKYVNDKIHAYYLGK